jgi:hypothetical protein
MRLEAGPREDEAGNEREDDAAHQTRNPGRPIGTPKVDYWRAAQAGISHVFPLARRQEYRGNCAAAEILARSRSPQPTSSGGPAALKVLRQPSRDGLCGCASGAKAKLPLPIIPEPGQPCLGDLFVSLGARAHADGAHDLAFPRVPKGRITGPLGEFPMLTGKLAQLTRIFNGALLSGAESTPASALIEACTQPPSCTVPSLVLKRTGITWPVSV